MVVMTPREKWTDERLDDLQAEMRQEFANVRAEMRAGFARVDADIRALRRDMIGGFFVVIAAIVGGNVF